MASKNSGQLDFETAALMKQAAAALLGRLDESNRPKIQNSLTGQVIRSIIRRNHGHHDCREDFLIWVESNLWTPRFDAETEGLDEVERGKVRLEVREFFKGRSDYHERDHGIQM